MSHNPPRGTPRKPYVRVHIPLGPPVTIGDLRRDGMTRALVYCNNKPHCYHSGRLDLTPWGDDVLLKSLEPKLRCTKCGAKGCNIRGDHSQMQIPGTMRNR